MQQVINGLSLGSVYALIAVGYSLVYSVLLFKFCPRRVSCDRRVHLLWGLEIYGGQYLAGGMLSLAGAGIAGFDGEG